MKKRISIAILTGYVTGVTIGAVWVGCEGAILMALLSAPLFMFMAADEYIWGQTAPMIAFVAIGQFVTLLIAGRKTERPILIVIGSFLLAGLLAFLGGSTAAAVSSV